MVEISTNREHKELDAAQEDSVVSGDRFIVYDPPANDAGAGVWNMEALVISRPNQSPIVVPYKITPAIDQEEQDNLRSEWFGSNDPETQTDLVDNEDKQVQELIYRFRTFRSIPYHKRLADRLLSLFNNAKEEDPNSLGIAAGSLRDFYDFLRLHNNLKYPSIFLTPDENIYATWKSNQNRVFSVHFLSNKDVRFVIFKPNKYDPERTIRFSGAATTDTLMDEIFSDSLDWITE